MMSDKAILTECFPNGIGLITFNRPERHNAFDDQVIKLVTDELLTLEQDSNVKIILLTANGKNFSAGADLDWMKRMVLYSEQENFEDAMQLVNLLKILSSLSKPTIALAKGSTLGGGVGLLSCCDIVLAHKDASFCFSEAKLGLIPATIAPYVIQAIGTRAAQYYFLTAKSFSAVEAKKIGLVHEVIEHEDFLAQGMNFAKLLLNNGPQALIAIKKLISRFVMTDDQLLEETARLIAKVRVSSEAQEGLKAFLEKRKPEWFKI